MSDRLIEKLARLAPLSKTSTVALRRAISPGRPVESKRDLVREGDRPGPAFTMAEGWACRYRILPSGTRQILSLLLPGDICDPHAGLVPEMDYGVQTLTSAVVATIDSAALAEAVGRHTEIARALRLLQMADEAACRNWITGMGRRSSTERLAHFLCELYLRVHSTSSAVGMPMTLPLSQLILAESLGMTPIHLNRVFRTLRTSGVVQLGRGSVTLVDVEELAHVAGFDDGYLIRRLRLAA